MDSGRFVHIILVWPFDSNGLSAAAYPSSLVMDLVCIAVLLFSTGSLTVDGGTVRSATSVTLASA